MTGTLGSGQVARRRPLEPVTEGSNPSSPALCFAPIVHVSLRCGDHRFTGQDFMAPIRPIVTLLTDFGEQDDYVGAMKGVILSIAPEAQVIDITHQIKPQSIIQAAAILESVYPYYPAHTIHVVVVDPGVGSERQPIAVGTSSGTFV